MKGVLWLFLALAAVGFFATFVFEASFEARSTRVQLVRREGGPQSRWLTVGAPFQVLDVPPSAVVEKGRDEVATLVDAEILRQSGGILPLESIHRFAWIARIGCLLAAALLVTGVRLLRRH